MSRWINGLFFALGVTFVLHGYSCNSENESELSNLESANSVVLAVVGNTEIGVDRYKAYLDRLPLEFRVNVEPLRYVDALIDEELLVQEAAARGLDRVSDVVDSVQHNRILLMQKVLYEHAGVGNSAIKIDSLRAYFSRSPYNRKVRFSLLMVRDSTKAIELLGLLRKGDDFDTISMQYSQDSRILERSADMGYHRWGDTMPEYAYLTERAFDMKIGEIEGPLKVADGFFILKVTDIHPVSFDQERVTIEKLFRREVVGQELLRYYDQLHKRYNVVYRPTAVKKLIQNTHSRSKQVDDQMVVVEYDGGILSMGKAIEMMRGLKVDKDALRREFARQILASLEAVRLEIPENPTVSKGVQDAYRKFSVRKLKNQLLSQISEPNVNALKLFFENYREQYKVPEKVEVDRFLTQDAQEAREFAGILKSGRKVAENRFVRLIYGSGAWQGENPVSRALKAPAGTAHGPFSTDTGYIVLRIVKRHEAHYPIFEEIEEVLRSDWIKDQTHRVLKDFASELRSRREKEISVNVQAVQLLNEKLSL